MVLCLLFIFWQFRLVNYFDSEIVRSFSAYFGKTRSESGVCGKTFKRKSHMRRHMRRHVRYQHFDKPPVAHKCQFCPKEFKLKRSLIRHVNVIHMKVFKFQCDEYDERLASKVQVLAHKRTKHGSLKLRCSNCDVSFNNLNEHKKICSTPQQREEHTCDQC